MTPHVPLDRVMTAVRSIPSPRQKETVMSAPEPSPAEPPEITVERVARAIFEADHHTHGGMAWDSDDFTDWERDVYRRLATAAIATLQLSPAARADDAVLVEGDWVSPSREAHARDLTKSWADAAGNADCPAAFVARMRSFVEVHDRNYRAAIAAPRADETTAAVGIAPAQSGDVLDGLWDR